MDFSIAAGGMAPAALLVARGADPLITIPAGHWYLTLRPGAPYVLPPGALVGNALPLSNIATSLACAIQNMPP